MTTNVHAFYGFKGGAGRSLLLAHFASMLAATGKSVLMIDSDLEAPGLGDFFEGIERRSFERWRAEPGMLDMLNELFISARRRQLGKKGSDTSVAAYMQTVLGVPEDRSKAWILPFGTSIGPSDSGGASRQSKLESVHQDIWLLGPGDHRAQQGVDSSRYLDSLLAFDWNAIMRSGGQQVLSEIGTYLREGNHGFDHILIDSRTGYNFSSLLLMQNFATHAIGVTSWNSQAIDGMARTLPIVAASARESDNIKRILIMNKGPDDSFDKKDTHLVKKQIVNHYFREGSIGNNIISFPFVSGIQFSESLIWERYYNSRSILDDNEEISQHSIDSQVRQIQANSIVQFVDSLFELYFVLTGEVFDLENSSLNRFDTRRSERSLSLQMAVGAEGAQQHPDYDGPLNGANQIIHEALDHFSQQSSDDDLRVNLPRDIRDHLRSDFLRFTTDQRKLVRNRILAALKQNDVRINNPNNSRQMDNAIEDLRQLFDLDLDPTSYVSVVAGSRRSDDGYTSPSIVSSDELSPIIQIFCTNIESSDAQQKHQKLELSLETGEMSPAWISFIEYLINWRNASLAIDEVTAFPFVADASRYLMSALDELDGFPLPITDRAFGQWNIYDTVGPFVEMVRFVLPVSSSGTDLFATLTAIEERLLKLLGDPRPWREQNATEGERDLFSSQWLRYLIFALEIRRILGSRRFHISDLIEQREMEELLATVGLPHPSAALSWEFSSTDQNEAADEDRFSASEIVRSIEIARLAYSTDTIIGWAKTLARKLLSHRMTRFTATDIDTGIRRLSKPEANSWAILLGQLSSVLEEDGGFLESFQLTRRALRIYSQSHIGFTDEDRKIPAANLFLFSSRFGAPLHPESVREIERTGFEESNNPEVDINNIGLKTWDIAGQYYGGRYLEALEYSDGIEQLSQSPVFRKSHVPSIIVPFLQFAALANANLGRMDAALDMFERYKQFCSLRIDNKSNAVALLALELARRCYNIKPNDIHAVDQLLSQCRYELPYLREESRALFNWQCSILEAIIHPDMSIPTTDWENVLHDQKIRRWQYNVQRTDFLDEESWTGLGIFPGNQIDSTMSAVITDVFAPYVELTLRRNDLTQAKHAIERWTRFLRAEMDVGDPTQVPIVAYGHALFHAFSRMLCDEDSSAEKAQKFAEIDIQQNGPERAFVYKSIFDLCGVNGLSVGSTR